MWVDHFRRRNARLSEQLEALQVWTHPFVIGELACGHLVRRTEIVASLDALPHAPLVNHDEVLEFVYRHRLQGRGLGWIDMHLLASARLARVALWTQDKKLAAAADDLKLSSVGH